MQPVRSIKQFQSCFKAVAAALFLGPVCSPHATTVSMPAAKTGPPAVSPLSISLHRSMKEGPAVKRLFPKGNAPFDLSLDLFRSLLQPARRIAHIHACSKKKACCKKACCIAPFDLSLDLFQSCFRADSALFQSCCSAVSELLQRCFRACCNPLEASLKVFPELFRFEFTSVSEVLQSLLHPARSITQSVSRAVASR